MYVRASPTSTCRRRKHPPKPAEHRQSRETIRGPQLPGPDPHAAPILERAGLRAAAAVRHGDGGWDLPPGHGAARLGAGPVEGGLCAAVAASDRRPLRREPEPTRPLLPVPGDPEAEP